MSAMTERKGVSMELVKVLSVLKAVKLKQYVKIKHYIPVIFSLFLFACGKPIVPPAQYNKPIPFHVNKSAELQWNYGKQCDSTLSTHADHSHGLIELAISSAVDSVQRKNNPSWYTLSYGKAEQAIFMTSLRDALIKNQVFNDVELVGETAEIKGNDVLINVLFQTARVASPERNYRITLTVVLNIRSKGTAPFQRSYLVQSDSKKFRFQDQQLDVSEKLLDKLICAIEEWYKLSLRK